MVEANSWIRERAANNTTYSIGQFSDSNNSVIFASSIKPEDLCIHFSAADVKIFSNGHVEYDETKANESARKFWQALRHWWPGLKET